MSEPKRFAERSIVQLTLARFRGFIREPEAVFWTFVFPILLAVGLGIAFRSRAPEKPHIGIVRSVSPLAAGLKRDTSVIVEEMDDSSASRSLRTGKVAMVVRIRSDNQVEYVYDPVRGESTPARLLVDGAI